jgi:hypothetical protein
LTLASHVSWVLATQFKAPLPKNHVSKLLVDDGRVRWFGLTSSGTSGNTLASGAVDGAGILLQGLVGQAAGTVGGLAGLDLGTSDVVDTLDVGDGGGGDGDEAKENGGDGKLHLG